MKNEKKKEYEWKGHTKKEEKKRTGKDIDKDDEEGEKEEQEWKGHTKKEKRNKRTGKDTDKDEILQFKQSSNLEAQYNKKKKKIQFSILFYLFISF